ncbi:MAG: DNA repair protein RecN [Candidatus Krumholzibacteriota bacterium]|nr:DNA repair protein RecN [Candidatus Krumholzibacteriota bacterium]
MGRSFEETLGEGNEKMLLSLKIKNLAVVEDTEITFDSGLNVITGSTGAGKTIILTAVDLLSGSRAKKSYLRRGARTLEVEGIFRPSGIRPPPLPPGRKGAEDILSIKREITAAGKSRIWINDRPTTSQNARRLTSLLFELHGQHRQQELLDPANHIRYLDDSGDYAGLKEECVSSIKEFRGQWQKLRELNKQHGEHRRQRDFLEFQLRELESLGLKDGLCDSLSRRINRLNNLQRLQSALDESRFLLEESDQSALASLAGAEKVLLSIAALDEGWKTLSLQISEMRVALQEIVRQIERAISDDQDEAEDIEMLQNRLSALQGAQRKYSLDEAGLISRRNELRGILKSLQGGSDEIIEAQRALDNLKGLLIPRLEKLSAARAARAEKLSRQVTADLQGLGMKGALFRVNMEKVNINAFQQPDIELDLPQDGWDRVEFMIRTNIGEETHPLSDVASGGELSRITLVLKKILIMGKGIPTLIFDEIDSGLGADLGAVVAEKIKDLSSHYQIITITHLPQVAASGDVHVLINKSVRGKRTVTQASILSGERRKSELARMIGGPGGLQEKLALEMLNGKSARSSAG